MPLTLSGRNLLYIHGEVVAKFLRLRFTCPCPSFQFFRCTTVADRIEQDLCDSATRRGILLSVGRYQRSSFGFFQEFIPIWRALFAIAYLQCAMS